jgi:hypothetical protein
MSLAMALIDTPERRPMYKLGYAFDVVAKKHIGYDEE